MQRYGIRVFGRSVMVVFFINILDDIASLWLGGRFLFHQLFFALLSFMYTSRII